MIRIAICDSEKSSVVRMEAAAAETLRELAVDCSIACFSSGEALLKQLERGPGFDLIYLAVKLAGISGVEVGKRLRGQFQNTKTLLIFLSSDQERVMELFECMTFRFLAKPLDPETFRAYLECACDLLEPNAKRRIAFKEIKGGPVSIPLRDVVCLESFGRELHVTTRTRTFRFFGKLGDLADQLSAYGFLRIHNSILVNFDYIASIRCESVTLRNGAVKDISGPKRKAVRADYARLRGEREIS